MAKKKSSTRQEKAIRHRNSSCVGPEDAVGSPSESLPSDLELLFDRSDTPVESFDDDGSLWPVKAVVSEEVDIFKTSIYQIDWDPWTRSDGTRTTWMPALPGPNTVLTSWKIVQTRKRRQEALKKPDIDLELIGSFKPHNIHTAEKTCAYSEKLKAWPAPDNWNVEKIPVNRKSSTRRHSHDFRKRKRGASEEHFPSPASSQRNPFSDAETTSSHQYIASSSGQSSSSVRRRKGTSREKLNTIWYVESRWNSEAIDNGAASIRILNEVDGDPPVDPSFVYLEASREYAEGIRKPDPRLLKGCDCKDGCRNPHICSCLAKSRCTNEDGNLCSAYDKKGRFQFTNAGEVVECNRNCTCRRCSNNVAQRPRKIPLELFKVWERGWGVRPTVYVPYGTVLGIFSGNLMSREDIVNLSPEEKEFSFDLDTRDNDPGFKNHRKYSICAHSVGNWSRFINHSCDPSVKVYSVVIDTTLQDNMPYIAFVARKDIPARSEITIDYNPKAVELMLKPKKKGKGKSKAKGVPCACGSELCRGFI